jgi:hypothetical protein
MLSVKNGEKIMQQRRLGKDGPMVGEIGLGAMSFAGTSGETDEATSHRTLDAAIERGEITSEKTNQRAKNFAWPPKAASFRSPEVSITQKII